MIKNFNYENYGYKVILYAYKNSKEIEKYTIEKEDENYAGKINIIGYKIRKDDILIDNFTVLMKL
jgi:hypothetical protein